jgi:hypothetical protein
VLCIDRIETIEPTTLRPGESPAQFAQRVKEDISCRANLTCLSWDGYMKNFMTREKRERLVSGQQADFVRDIQSRSTLRQMVTIQIL